MKNSKTIQNPKELNKVIKEYNDSIEHTTAPFYLKYPYLDLIVEKPISHKKYKYILKANQITNNALFIVQAMNLLLGNYEEYLSIRSNTPNPWHHPLQNIELYKTFLGRKISNLLSSCYAYTEHTKKLYHNIQNTPNFSFLKSKHVKNSCSILEEVRNYVQHTGLPIHQIQFGENACNITVHLDILKNNKNSNMSLLDDYPEKIIDLTAIIPKYIESIWLLHTEIMRLIDSRTLSSFKEIESAITEVQLLSEKENINQCVVVQNQGKIVQQNISSRALELFKLYNQLNQDLYLKLRDYSAKPD